MSALLTTEELARRWRLHPKTLSNWRVKGMGPRFIKLGDGDKGAVRYRLEDVLAFERPEQDQDEVTS